MAWYRLNITKYLLKWPEKHQKGPKFNKKILSTFTHVYRRLRFLTIVMWFQIFDPHRHLATLSARGDLLAIYLFTAILDWKLNHLCLRPSALGSNIKAFILVEEKIKSIAHKKQSKFFWLV